MQKERQRPKTGGHLAGNGLEKKTSFFLLVEIHGNYAHRLLVKGRECLATSNQQQQQQQPATSNWQLAMGN